MERKIRMEVSGSGVGGGYDHCCENVILVMVMVVVVIMVVMVIMCMENRLSGLRICLIKVLHFIIVTSDSSIYSYEPHNDSMLQQNNAAPTSSDSHLGGMCGRILLIHTTSCISSKEGSLGTQLKYGR
jgi:hypothetical protein